MRVFRNISYAPFGRQYITINAKYRSRVYVAQGLVHSIDKLISVQIAQKSPQLYFHLLNSIFIKLLLVKNTFKNNCDQQGIAGLLRMSWFNPELQGWIPFGFNSFIFIFCSKILHQLWKFLAKSLQVSCQLKLTDITNTSKQEKYYLKYVSLFVMKITL